MGKSAPASPDYKGAAQAQSAESAKNISQQTQANRPNQSNGFASSQWTQDANGNWTQNNSLSGGLGVAQGGLMNQAAGLAGGMDWSQFGKLGDGSDAREQAIKASYDSAASRLNPQWAQRGQAMSAQLANAGLDPNSQAARNAQRQFSQQQNDAYAGAMNNAIQNGNQAQALTFNQNMQARQQAIAEALRQRGQPLDELKALQGFLQQGNFMGAGAADPTNFLGAAAAQGNYDMNAWQAENQANADLYGAGMDLLKTAGPAAMALSDERAKTNIRRHAAEAIPGVPLASWDFLPEHGGAHGVGVIAQDLQKVRPDLVIRRPDGFLMVDYAGLRGDK